MCRLTGDTKCQNGSCLSGFETLPEMRCQSFVTQARGGTLKVLRRILSKIFTTESTEVHGAMPQSRGESSGYFDFGFVHQQNGNVVADWVNPVALGAFQAFAVCPYRQRLLTERANQNIEQILRDHQRILPHWLAASQV